MGPARPDLITFLEPGRGWAIPLPASQSLLLWLVGRLPDRRRTPRTHCLLPLGKESSTNLNSSPRSALLSKLSELSSSL